MGWIIITAITLLASIGSVFFGIKIHKVLKDEQTRKHLTPIGQRLDLIAYGVAGVILACWGFITLATSVYTQNPGQASVLVSFSGVVEGINYEPGFHAKAPYAERVEYDIRNNTLSYVGVAGNNDNYIGGDVSGPQITFQDANGVTGNIDLNVRYSVNGDAVGDIYNEYKTQQEFVNATLAPDVRSKTREILSKYQTSQVYNERDTVQQELMISLQQSWEKLGVVVEEIYLQEVRYPESVVNSFAQAQAAKAEVEKAKAEQEKAKIEADTNRIKSEALSEPVLMEKLIEAIKNGNGTYVLGGDNFAIGL